MESISPRNDGALHLLRMLGRHRQHFEGQLRQQLESDGVVGSLDFEWLDAPYNPKAPDKEGEWRSVDFLPDHGGSAWKNYWPDGRAGTLNRDGVPSWDVVGRKAPSGSGRRDRPGTRLTGLRGFVSISRFAWR